MVGESKKDLIDIKDKEHFCKLYPISYSISIPFCRVRVTHVTLRDVLDY